MLDPLLYRWSVAPVVIRCVHWTMQREVLQTWITSQGPAIVMNILLPNWFVLLRLNCTNKPSPQSKHPSGIIHGSYQRLFDPWPLAKFDFLDSMKKASNNSAHKVASKGADRSNKRCTLYKMCREIWNSIFHSCDVDCLHLKLPFGSHKLQLPQAP